MQKERFTYILEKLDQKGRVLVGELSRELQVSEMTIRSDLNLLAQKGLLKRIHGGAEQLGESLYKGNIRENLYRNAGGKIAIAKAACAQIQTGDRILADDSSTCLYLIRQLKQEPGKQVCLYTNSVLAAVELLEVSHIRLHLIGGEIAGNLASTSGPAAEQELMSLHADLCFFGANGVSAENGASVIGYSQMKLKQCMLKASRKHILLADSQKFGLNFLSVICPLSDIDLLITDRGPASAALMQIQSQVSLLRSDF